MLGNFRWATTVGDPMGVWRIRDAADRLYQVGRNGERWCKPPCQGRGALLTSSYALLYFPSCHGRPVARSKKDGGAG